MNIQIIADTHINHSKMIGWGLRPENFEELIFKGLQNLPSDCLFIHLGDVCIGGDEEVHQKYFKPLKCKKILVLGNHDHKSMHWYLNNGWDMACTKFEIGYMGTKIIFTHVPEKVPAVDFNVHGHLHGDDHRNVEFKDILCQNNILYSCEEFNYHPIKLETLIYKRINHGGNIERKV